MIFKNLYTNIVVRIILISATCFLLPFALNKYHDIVININIIAVLLIQILLLIKRLNYINRDLISFFDSLKYNDSSILLTNEFQDQNYLRLSRRFHDVNRQIVKLKEKNVSQDHYFKTVIELANVGLMGFNENGTIKLSNRALNELLNMKDLANINHLNSLHPDFSDILTKLEPSKQKLLKINLNEKTGTRLLNLLIKSTEFKTKDEKIKLISIQDIKNELDEKELESWQKLIRILQHEIMNSIGPISSTIDTLNELIINPDNNQPYKSDEINNELIQDITSGLKIIKERNIGLQNFVNTFRTISRLPKPQFDKIDLNSLFSDIKLFWKTEFKNKGIQFETITNDEIFIVADKNQIEQVIINLIKNSVEAESNKISISANVSNTNRINIQITDNGKGIAKELIDEIFMPFFTTKEQGSGIGLSLARQIMRLHGGNIYVQSVPETETTFTLTF